MSIYEHIDKLKQLKTNFKQEFLSKGVDLSQEEFSNYYKHVSSLGTSLQLYPVNLYREYTNLIIEDNNNGSFATSYDIYDNGVKIDEIKNKIYSIQNLICGEHNFYVIAKGENFIASQNSNPYYYPVFSYTKSYTGIISSYNFNVGMYQTVTDYLSVTDGGYLPREITVLVGGQVAEYVYNCYTGELIISNVTGDVNVVAFSSQYPILNAPKVNVYFNDISWDKIENATSYRVYNGNELILETENTSVNLTNYLQSGQNYNVFVTAVASGFQESPFLEGVVVSVENLYPMYGVSGLDGDTETLQRLYDSRDMTYYYNTSKGEIVSDFDQVFPFSEISVETLDGNKMVKIPRMYFKIETNSGRLSAISVSRYPREEDGWFESEKFYVGAYLSSTKEDKAVSVSGASIISTGTFSQQKSKALLNGDEYGILSVQQRNVIAFLMIIEFGTKNLSSLQLKSSSISTTGYSDVVLTATGCNMQNGVFRYRNIEDAIGGKPTFMDNIKMIYGYVYVSKNGTDYINSEEFYNSCTLYIKSFKWKNDFPFVLFPDELVSDNLGTFNSQLHCKETDEYGLTTNSRGPICYTTAYAANYSGGCCRLVKEVNNDN